jgi:arylsulfatase A-like enzyme
MSARAVGRFGLILISVVATAAAWRMSQLAATPIGLVVITLDTTRADRLSPYGFMNISLPAIERLAREGVVFDDATTAVPLTLPSHTSLFTGLLPPDHGVRDNADPPLAESKATLAQTLLSRGFRTGAFVGSIVLNPDRGLQRGFEVYHGVTGGPPDTPQGRQRRADAVTDDALQWLDTVGDAPFFLWAHFYDAHRPYDPPEPFASTYGHDPYLGEIAFADAQIGRLLEALESRHLLNRTVVVVAGDHGESLGEHGERDHGVFVYESVLRVPLIIRAPSMRATRVGSAVRLIDVMPTVLDLLHVPAPPIDGVSTVDLMTGRRTDLKLPIYAESLYPERLGWSGLRALREGQFKFIDAPRPELYDLAEDPFEEVNLYANRRALADSLRIVAASLAKGTNGSAGSAERSRVSPQLQARIEALGYVAGGVTSGAASAGARPDPKDCMPLRSNPADQRVRPLACGWWPALEAPTPAGRSGNR